MKFKILTIQFYNRFGVLDSHEINVEGKTPLQIMHALVKWYKKYEIEVVHVELQ